jgi:four helix bundle protein
MSEGNITLNKSFEFAIRVVNLYKYLCDEKKEYIISKQLLRCGTSIGANINEASAAQSKKDFIAKMSISSKEARETKYWIDLLIATDYLSENDKHTKSLIVDIEELIKLLTSIVKTSQENFKKESINTPKGKQ